MSRSHNEEVSIVSEPPKLNGVVDEPSPPARPVSVNAQRPASNELNPYRRHEAMSAESRSPTPLNHPDGASSSISIGAIDNSLSWPWKHPDAVSSVAKFNEMTMILTFNHIVAELSIWLAVFTRISNWATLLEENTGPFPPSFNFHRVVE